MTSVVCLQLVYHAVEKPNKLNSSSVTVCGQCLHPLEQTHLLMEDSYEL